ncbi:MAG: hypothetical protein HYV93_24260 [Candidatus Rokubacteria bacterium]|nr:hypothetical protein [Candidatus Rokubacteria bacterium]
MTGMRGLGVRGEQWALAGTLVLAVVLGLCLLHGATGGAHHDEISPDLCTGLFLLAFVVTLVFLAEVGALPADPLRAVLAVSRHLLDPPPKRGSLPQSIS